jgi:hypothetical protein
MSSEIAKTIVDQIANGKLDAAKESVFTGMKEKAAETVDMKRVEMQVDWVNNTSQEDK